MQRMIEQRYTIKFCIELRKSATETLGAICQVLKNEGKSQTIVYKWHKLSEEDRESVKDKPCTGQPLSSRTDDNVQRVREVLNLDRRLNMCMVFEIDIDKMTIHRSVLNSSLRS